MEATCVIDHFSTITNGYTLPVWVTAAAKAATEVLLGEPFTAKQIIHRPNDEENLIIPVTSAALVADSNHAIGISHCQSGLPLDVTRGMEIWTYVQLKKHNLAQDQFDEIGSSEPWLQLVAGYGVGKSKSTSKPCISEFAYNLFELNLRNLIPVGFQLQLEIIFPLGKELAKRTSNDSFGIVDGLSIIGTQAEVQVSASPDQVQNSIHELRNRALQANFTRKFIFVIGENGYDLALKFGFPRESILKVGNWIGPLIIAAAESGVEKLLLFGYHGKLIKLAGSIFHTHNHLADARLEILTSLAVREGLPLDLIQSLGSSSSIEEASLMLNSKHPELLKQLWFRIANEIEKKSHAYLNRYASSDMEIGAALFDRKRELRWYGPYGVKQLNALGLTLQS